MTEAQDLSRLTLHETERHVEDDVASPDDESLLTVVEEVAYHAEKDKEGEDVQDLVLLLHHLYRRPLHDEHETDETEEDDEQLGDELWRELEVADVEYDVRRVADDSVDETVGCDEDREEKQTEQVHTQVARTPHAEEGEEDCAPDEQQQCKDQQMCNGRYPPVVGEDLRREEEGGRHGAARLDYQGEDVEEELRQDSDDERPRPADKLDEVLSVEDYRDDRQQEPEPEQQIFDEEAEPLDLGMSVANGEEEISRGVGYIAATATRTER